MESWRHAWRKGFAPLLDVMALRALKRGLEVDDERLCQGATTVPPPLNCTQEWACEAACAIGYCGWQGCELDTIGEVEEFFARMCFSADQLLGEPAGGKHFLNWYDETPREEMRRLLLEEVNLALEKHDAENTLGSAGDNPVDLPYFVRVT